MILSPETNVSLSPPFPHQFIEKKKSNDPENGNQRAPDKIRRADFAQVNLNRKRKSVAERQKLHSLLKDSRDKADGQDGPAQEAPAGPKQAV